MPMLNGNMDEKAMRKMLAEKRRLIPRRPKGVDPMGEHDLPMLKQLLGSMHPEGECSDEQWKEILREYNEQKTKKEEEGYIDEQPDNVIEYNK